MQKSFYPKQRLWIFIWVISILSGCGSSKSSQEATAPDPYARELSAQGTGATLWAQQSAEARLMYLQTYHYAQLQLDRKLRLRNFNRPAIVLDLDETVLDNSAYQARQINEGSLYSETSWNAWVREEKATALPGALDFVNYARSQGVELFYISNRSEEVRAATINNLIKLGFPSVDNQHVLLKSRESDKTSRRNMVTSEYQVLFYLGDNLRDFSELFNDRKEEQGKRLVDENIQDLLNNFILFPNPMYGEWEEAILNNERDLTPRQQMDLRKERLEY
jgi:5'-nucleotidase (lipoprotein e(P4) family)